MFKDLVIKNRSTRKYDQSVAISREILLELVDLARISNSGGNWQPLKYYLSWTPEKNALIFSHIGLAGNPKEGERPAAYIIILYDNGLGQYTGSKIDHGIAAHSIVLGATEKGLAGCMIGMTTRGKPLKEALSLPDRYDVVLGVAIGKPNESFVIEALPKDSTKVSGWWDEQGVRHVPKRQLQDIIIE